MKNKVILLFSAAIAFTTSITMLNATEPAANPKQAEVENCNFLNDLVIDTTKQSNKEKKLQKKEELNKKISNWEKQLEAGHCKKTTKELSCKEVQELIDATQKKLDDLKNHLKSCK